MDDIKRTMIASLLIEQAMELKGKRPSELSFEELIDVVQSLVKKYSKTDYCCEEFKFEYFVSYKYYSDKQEGFGNVKYITNREMDIDLIREIEKDLNKQEEVGKSIIINWQLL